MLYLIRSFGRGVDNKTLKVGYTNNPEARSFSYYLHNPKYEPISTRQGSQEDECLLHKYLTALGYKAEFLNEWFIDDPEVLRRFHDTASRMRRIVWNNRVQVFKASEFKSISNFGYKLYKSLWKQYGKGRYTTDLDKAWKMEETKRLVKSIKEDFFPG